jgi:hypothetical protein
VDANRLGAAIAHDRFGQPLCFLRSHAHPNNETAFHDHGLDQLRPLLAEVTGGEGAQAATRCSGRGGRCESGGQAPTGRDDTHRRDGGADREQDAERGREARRDIVTMNEGAPRRAGDVGELLHGNEHRSKTLTDGFDIRHDIDIGAIEPVEFELIDHLLQDFRSPDDAGNLANDSLLHDFVAFGLHGGSLLKRRL